MKENSQGKAYVKLGGRHLHRIVAEQKLGRSLLPGEVVHHIDGNILNNSPENIEVHKSQGDHMAEHRPEMMLARRLKHGY